MYASILPALLFFILSPGILTRIPKNGSKYLITFVHSIIFAILLHFLMRNLPIYEGMADAGQIVGYIFLGCVIYVLGVISFFFILPSNKKDNF